MLVLATMSSLLGGEIGASFVVFGRLRKVTSAVVPGWSCFWPRDVVNYLAKCVFEFLVGSGHLRCAVSVPVSLFLSLFLWAGAGSGAEAGTLKSLPNRTDLVLCVSARIAQKGWLLCTWIPLPVLLVATCGNCWWCALATCSSPDKSSEPTASRAMSVTSLPSHSRVGVVHRIHVADSHLQALLEVSQRSVGTKTIPGDCLAFVERLWHHKSLKAAFV